MRTTVTLDDSLLKQAEELTGIKQRPELLRQALVALVQQESARRLAALGGSDPEATRPPRR
ncbi:MAG: type II toxin-antitoxin system VapB family antitoxin [Sphingomonadales bacterium]